MAIREIILDTETTGLDPKNGHRIVEIGAIEMVDKVLTGREFHCYINPERDMPIEAYKVHGISDNFLKDKPLFRDIADEFNEFIKNGKLVIHNAPFDIKFLNYELTLVNLASIELAQVVDTLTMARKMFPGSRANLDALCKRFKIDNKHRSQHGAIIDSQLLAEVYVELCGGRQASFELMQKNTKKDSDHINNNIQTVQGNKIVITPTEEELTAHAYFIKNLLG